MDGLTKFVYGGARKLKAATTEEYMSEFKPQKIVAPKQDEDIKEFMN
jgi:hypothetical protein